MRLSLSASFSLLASAGLTNAVRLNIKRVPSEGAYFGTTGVPSAQLEGDDDSDIGNVNNQRYTTNITLNGVEVPVLLDTGSTDLWVEYDLGEGLTLPNISTRLAFGDGSAFLDGEIAIAQLEFGGYTIPKQAFMNAKTSQGFQYDFSTGIYGLLGLSFDSPGASRVNDAVVKAYGNVKWGQSALANIFDQHPDKENLIGMALSRTGDLEDTDEGSLDIGEYGEDYQDAKNAPHLPLFPKGSSRWSVVMEGITVNNKSIPLQSKVPNAPAGTQVSLLDSGTTNVLLSPTYLNAIYSEVAGAVFMANSTIPPVRWSGDKNLWVVPCMASVVASAQFGGQTFPIHPLDMTDITVVTAPDGNKYTVCLSAFASIGKIGGTSFDGLWGASFLRNTYTVYDFGDSTSTRDPSGSAFIQLVTRTNVDEALDELRIVRAETLKSMPKELEPAALIALFQKQSAATTATASGSIPVGSGTAAGANSLSGFAENDGSESSSSNNALIEKWAPIVAGLLGANLIIGLVLVGLGVATCVKRGGKAKVATYASVPYKD